MLDCYVEEILGCISGEPMDLDDRDLGILYGRMIMCATDRSAAFVWRPEAISENM